MRIQNTILVLLALLFSGGVNAQKVDITNPTIDKIDNSVIICFDAIVETISYDGKIAKISTNSMLTLTPILWSADKEHSLPPIVVMGRNRAIMQARKGGIKAGSIVAKSNETTPYKITIPFEKWMEGVSLRMDRVLEGCCDKVMLSPTSIANNILNPTLPPIVPLFESDIKMAYLRDFQSTVNDYPFVHISGEKADSEKNGLIIYFKQGVTTIQKSYMDNENSLRKIQEAIELIESESNIKLTKISIVGGSSPEGTFIYNQKIGQSRAESLINYLSHDVNYYVFDVENIGENWSGLYRMVENSNMEYKDEVLSIIDTYSIHGGREKKLMDLKVGNPYRYMLKEFFPELRKASYVQIFYDIKPNEEFVKIDRASEFIKVKSYKAALKLVLRHIWCTCKSFYTG